LLLALGFSLLWSSVAGATLFLHFDGITGGSEIEDHQGWSEILDVSWGVAQTGGGVGGGAGKPVFQDLTWNMLLDKSVTSLFNYISTGRHIKDATVDFTFAINDNNVTYFQMYFKQVNLTNLMLQGTSSALPTLFGAFEYAFIKLTYTEFTETGSVAGQTWASFDLALNRGEMGALAALFARGLSGPTTVAAAPIPASLWLLAPVLIGLAALGRRAKR
jgi:type VI protein secretion system component Hcp